MTPLIASPANPPARLTGGLALLGRECCPSPPLTTSDAIMKPRVVFVQGYELRAQAMQRTNFRAGSIVHHTTGGRSNGGHVTTVAGVDVAINHVGQYEGVRLAPGEASPVQSGFTLGINLKGLSLAAPLNVFGFGQYATGGPVPQFTPNFLVRVSTDRRLQLFGFHRVAGVLVFEAITDESTEQLPDDGWAQLEGQVGMAPAFNATGGFGLLNLHIDGETPPEGLPIFRAVGVPLEGVIDDVAWGTEVMANLGGNGMASNGLSGVGIDDVHVCRPYGTVKRYLRDTRIGAAVPVGDGDQVSSLIAFDSRHTWSRPAGLGPAVSLDVGVATTHGSVERWRNVVNNDRDDAEVLSNLSWSTVSPASVAYGLINNSNAWVTGPYVPPVYAQNSGAADLTDPANWGTAFDLAAENALTRNTVMDENPDYFRVGITRTDIAAVEGLFPFIRAGSRWLVGAIFATNIGQIEDLFTFVSPISYRIVDLEYVQNRNLYALLLRFGGVDIVQRPEFAGSLGASGGPGGLWQPRLGYQVAVDAGVVYPWNAYPYSFIEFKPGTSERFAPTELAQVQAGVRGDFTLYDHEGGDPDPLHRREQIDVCEIGFEFSYHPTVVEEIEHGPYPPQAGVVVVALNRTTRQVTIKDASIDWDGTVASRTVNWGDGTTEALPAAPTTKSHTYAVPGTYTITVTATDNDGLTGTVTTSIDAFVLNAAPAASFTFEAEGGDPLTIDFTDTSTDDGSIVAWLWNFGDPDIPGGGTSTLQNPSHTYGAAGDYPVSLTVTDNGGEASQPPLTDEVTQTVTVTEGGGSVGNRVNMPILFGFTGGATAEANGPFSSEFYGRMYVNEGPTPRDGVGMDAQGALEEAFDDEYFEYSEGSSGTPERFYQICPDPNGASPATEMPLLQLYPTVVMVSIKTDKRWRLYTDDGAGGLMLLGTTVNPVPDGTPGTLRVKYGNTGTGYLCLRVNGETLEFAAQTVWNAGNGAGQFLSAEFGTGSGQFFAAPAGYTVGRVGMRWSNCLVFDATGQADQDHAGLVHGFVRRPSAMGTDNDVGAASSDLRDDNGDTSFAAFNTAGQKASCTIDALGVTPTTILGVAPFRCDKKVSGTSLTRRSYIRNGGNVTNGATGNAQNSYLGDNNAATPNRSGVVANDPATAAPWANAAAVDTLEVGYEVTALTGAGNTRLTMMGVEIWCWMD